MAWSSKTSATQLTAITTEQYFSFGGSQVVSLNPGESVHLQFQADFPSSPTDHATFSVYTTLDDSSETWDKTPAYVFNLDKATDPGVAAVILSGFYKFRVGVKRSGSTDTITSADCAHRKDGISV